MAKKILTTIKIESLNGVRFPEPKVYKIYYDGVFFAYDNEIYNFVPETNKGSRHETVKKEGDLMGSKRMVNIIKAGSPEQVKTAIYAGLTQYYGEEIKEQKIISYRVKFNSNKHYFNHSESISFADTPALSFWWRIHYLVKFPDGREKIFSSPYKGYGNVCTNKFNYNVSDYKEKWMIWTEERQLFFENTEASMENMIKKLVEFFNQDPVLLSSGIDNKQLLLG